MAVEGSSGEKMFGCTPGVIRAATGAVEVRGDAEAAAMVDIERL